MSFVQDPNFVQPSHNYIPQVSSWQYSTFIKRWAVEALQDGFAASISPRAVAAKIGYDFNQDDYTLPAVLVKWDERDNINAGVGHEEWLPSPYDPDPTNPSTYIKYYHRLYHGDLSFEVYGQSSMDAALVRDAVAEILATTDATPWGNAFIQRLYFYANQTPYGYWNIPSLNTDHVMPIAESVRQLPWVPEEDRLAYCAGYRINVMGDLYSATPSAESNYGGSSIIQQVDLTIVQQNVLNDASSASTTDYYTFTGWPTGAYDI